LIIAGFGVNELLITPCPRNWGISSMTGVPNYDARTFRRALGQFATGVAVVTAEVEGIRLSATVNSFSSVSLEPPLVLFSLARAALSFELWQRVESFAVMVLSGDQTEISNRFATAGSDKWRDIDVVAGRNGAPLIPGALACFECRMHARYDGGDHEILVGRVEQYSVGGAPVSGPLIFFEGKYRRLHEAFPSSAEGVKS
jgi:flavin reductase (DIM6/NTAB) family NADH-FMN oxidoreductase RutF